MVLRTQPGRGAGHRQTGGLRFGGLAALGRALWLAYRSLRHERTAFVYASLTLALGFAVAAVNFSAIRGFTRPLPVPRGAEIVRVTANAPSGDAMALSGAEARLLAAEPVFASAGIYVTRRELLAAAGRPPLRVGVAAVDRGVFETLRVPPLMGRLPARDDRDAVMIGEDLWRSWLAADAGVIGSVVGVGGEARTVVAVMPSPVRFPLSQQVWLPLSPSARPEVAEIVARLAPGVGREAAAARLGLTLQRAGGAAAEESARVRVLGHTEGRGEAGEERALTALLFAVIALVLVSCSNVSSLLGLRAQVRSRALSVHRALGARPAEVVRQVLAESLIVASAGAAGGLLLAWGLTNALQSRLAPHWGYPWMDIRLQPSVLLLLGGLAAVTAGVSGALPALRAARADLMEPLRREAQASRAARATGSWVFLTAQIALSAVALVAAIVLTVGLVSTRRVGGTVDPKSVMMASVLLEGAGYDSATERAAFERRLLARLDDSAEITHPVLGSGTPLLTGSVQRVRVEGEEEGATQRRVPVLETSAGLFDLYRLETVEGRLFDDRGLYSSHRGGATRLTEPKPVAVVSASFAERYLTGRTAVGSRLRLAGEQWVRVVGVVSDLQLVSRDRERGRPIVYLPLRPGANGRLSVSAQVSADGGARALERIVREVDPNLPLEQSIVGRRVLSLDDLLEYLLRIPRVLSWLAAVAGAGVLVVVGLGLYGLLAFEVEQRRGELGIRQALGADRRSVLSLVLGAGARRLAPGLLIGLTLAWLVLPLFGVFLSGAEARDPRLLLGLVGLYAAMTLLAVIGPGRRAANCDPASVLRGD